MLSSLVVAAGLALSMAASPAAAADSSLTNQCLTNKYQFSANRMYTRSGASTDVYDANVDVSGYDFTIDYSSSNVALDQKSMYLTLSAPPSNSNLGEGVRVSHTRPVLYGRFSVAITAPASSLGGVVTTFITMSDDKDEIDWEIVGQNGSAAQSNVFYRGIQETGKFGETHSIGGSTSDTHVYTIDWKPDVLKWFVDGNLVRTWTKAQSQYSSALTAAAGYPNGVQWFPDSPSMIQFSVWDGGDSSQAGTAAWAGGPVNFKNGVIRARYDYLDVQCYDGSGNNIASASGAKSLGSDGGSNNSTANSVGSTQGAGTAGTTNTGSGTSDPSKPSLGSGASRPSALVSGVLTIAGAVALSSFFF